MSRTPEAFIEEAILPHLIVVPVLAALSLLALGFCIYMFKNQGYYDTWEVGVTIFSVLSAIGVIVSMVIFVPFEREHHFYHSVEGSVTEVSNVWDSGSGDLTRVPVVTLDSTDAPLVVSDPRIVGMVGEDVRLLCTVEFVWMSADRYNCTIQEVIR